MFRYALPSAQTAEDSVRAFYCDHFVLPLPDGHRFPMEKYARLRERVMKVPGVDLSVPPPATDEELLRVHSENYLDGVVRGSLTDSEVRKIGFPWSPQLVERSRRSVGGTIQAARVALVEGAAVNLAGGTHHAFKGHGEGFCVFNDVAVAALDVLSREPSLRIAVVDLDVHQGNGTARIFRHDDRVFTLSVHGEANYPFKKEKSDVDIGLEDGATDELFLDAVRSGLDSVLQARPHLIFYVAGADAYEGDRLGRLKVTQAGLATRDDLVFDAAATNGASVVTVMAGGYARNTDDTVSIHESSVRRATRYHHLQEFVGST